MLSIPTKHLNQRGFTLIELLILLTMVATLVGMALPSFRDMINEGNQTAQRKNFLNALNLARSEAIKRGLTVSICTADGSVSAVVPACDNSLDWESGWVAFIDENADGARDPVDDTVILVGSALDSGYTLRGSVNITNVISYLPDGDTSASGTLTLCDSRGEDKAEAVIISASGRPKVSDTAAGGVALVCPP